MRQEETGDKRVPVAAARSGPLAGKLAPEYPEWSGCQSQRRRVQISFRAVLSHHSDSESFLVVHALFSQDGCQREGFWEVVGHVSPFDLSRILSVGGSLISSVFLSRSSCKTTHADGYYGAWPGWAVSISMLPLTLLD